MSIGVRTKHDRVVGKEFEKCRPNTALRGSLFKCLFSNEDRLDVRLGKYRGRGDKNNQ
jgi:hypothetical protein